MKKLAIIGLVPLCAGFLFAQSETRSTTTTTSTYNGNLVDAGCVVHQRQTKQVNNENGAVTSSRETTYTTNCPVKDTTTEFGLVTPQGQYYQFAPNSNQQVVTMIRKHHKWHTYISGGQPINVQVVGAPTGDTVVVREIR